ncbi:Glycosyl transferase family 2 [Halalkaliarchaeum sp. AArc-CO]|uniref:glycosyltransferase n=1 Tax=Halalkaliarchaeum sp. AArc-CO TaxID=2866381 RepID=UPI00217E4C56|nr:glycosyltransferase family 2 protein [Halalkaliarchaeum sp. AArc-CO]UWG50949.1 Glycosyl transferase family 2 [Halalkaliarchaeum sp. AArc-CO]
MSRDPPASVLLPTTVWTSAIEEVADQLGPSDELLVICDTASDPVDRDVSEDTGAVRLVIAGEPVGCSGKANAIAAGMEAAEHDRIVWTDDDFHHPDDWLERLLSAYDRQGPTTEVPSFVGRDPLSTLFEPQYALGGTAGVYFGDVAWAGAVVFERNDLPDEGMFVRDLRSTVSDDGLLTDRLDITPVKRVRRVEVGGTVRETLERHVRFVQIVRRHAPAGFAINGVLALGTTVAGVLFPLPTLALLTGLFAVLYAAFGVRRWTFLLAYPSVMVSVPFLAYGLLRRTFVWGGRRYRWRSLFDVEVVE